MSKKHTCYRHELTAKSQIMEEESQLLNELMLVADSEQIGEIWKLYQSLSPAARNFCLRGILHYSCFPQLSYLAEILADVTKIDFLQKLPTEISHRILRYLDATSLCRSSQTCSTWRSICDDDRIWKRMCSQHIQKKCAKCGWGLPLMQPQKLLKRNFEAMNESDVAIKYQPDYKLQQTKKSWKSIYAERSVVAKNWRRSKFTTKSLIGHTDAVTSLYFDDSRNCLISGSTDNTLRLWNITNGTCVGILKGHTDSVRGVQFDCSKIVSCSMDRTIRIWNLKTLTCMRIIQTQAPLACLHFIDRLLASGATDGSIKVWNLEEGTSFTLQAHMQSTNKVRILPGKSMMLSCSNDSSMILWDIRTKQSVRTFLGHNGPILSLSLLIPFHSPKDHHNQQVVTASSDGSIKIWDFNSGDLLKTLKGHTAMVTCVEANPIRIVSGGHDTTLRIWDSDYTCKQVIDTASNVNEVWLDDTKLIYAEVTGDITIRCFLGV